MEYIAAVVVVVIILAVVVYFRTSKPASKPNEETKAALEYKYARKQFIMTRDENKFYKALQEAVGGAYMIYPQAHLDLFLDHKVAGQNWRAALSKIQRKSVDFLICSREYYDPLVAIELDGVSRTEDERMARDDFVDGICKEANMPIVHILSNGQYSSSDILQKISPYLR